MVLANIVVGALLYQWASLGIVSGGRRAIKHRNGTAIFVIPLKNNQWLAGIIALNLFKPLIIEVVVM